jgi:hypothetical protein
MCAGSYAPFALARRFRVMSPTLARALLQTSNVRGTLHNHPSRVVVQMVSHRRRGAEGHLLRPLPRPIHAKGQ